MESRGRRDLDEVLVAYVSVHVSHSDSPSSMRSGTSSSVSIQLSEEGVLDSSDRLRFRGLAISSSWKVLLPRSLGAVRRVRTVRRGLAVTKRFLNRKLSWSELSASDPGRRFNVAAPTTPRRRRFGGCRTGVAACLSFKGVALLVGGSRRCLDLVRTAGNVWTGMTGGENERKRGRK